MKRGKEGFSNIISFLAFFISILVIYLANDADAKPQEAIAAAAEAANAIDANSAGATSHYRPLSRPVWRYPSHRRQYYSQRRPSTPSKWYAHYFRPQNWRHWGYRRTRPVRRPSNSSRRRYRPNHGK